MRFSYKRWLNLIVVLIAVVGIGTGIYAWKVYQSGEGFLPDDSVMGREISRNQVVFENQDEYSSEEGREDEDSSMWEEDKDTEDKFDLREQLDASYLYKTNTKTTKQAVMAKRNDNNHLEEEPESDSNAEAPVILSYDTEKNDDNSKKDETVIINNDNSNNNIVNTANGPGVSVPNVSDTVNKHEDSDNSPIHTPPAYTYRPNEPYQTSKPTDEPDDEKPKQTSKPTKEPTPKVTPTPKPPVETIKPSETFDPADAPDPKPQKPGTLLPGEPDVVYPDEGLEKEDDKTYEFLSYTEYPDILGHERIYYGEKLTPEKILYSGIYNIRVADKTTDKTIEVYRLNDYGEYFWLEDYPSVVKDDTVKITFGYRIENNAKKYTVDVEYPVSLYKLLIMGEKGKIYGYNSYDTYVNILFPEAGEEVDLSSYFGMMNDDYKIYESDDIFAMPVLTKIFPGWIEVKNGEPVPLKYSMKEKGRTVLHPMDARTVPDGYKAVDWFDMGIPTLTDVPCDKEVWSIPEGIIQVHIDGLDSAIWERPASKDVGRVIEIPYSVNEMDMENFTAWEEFRVDSNNVAYTAKDGILYSKDETEIKSIPLEKKKIKVDSQVKSVYIPAGNSLNSVTVEGNTLVDMNVENLNDAIIYVPYKAMAKYYAAWNDRLGSNVKLMGYTEKEDDAQEFPDYIKENGLIMSSDRKILYLIEDTVSGLCELPDTIETIETGALDNNTGIDVLVLPESLKTLKPGSLNSDALEKCMFIGNTPPSAGEYTFADEVKVYVKRSAIDSYIEKWQDIAGINPDKRIVASDFRVVCTDEGFRYLSETGEDSGETNTLLSVPDDIEIYTGEQLEGVDIHIISSHAFKNCMSLKLVILSESVRQICDGAFEGCGMLEGVYSYNEDTIAIGSSTFAGCSNIRFTVWNAAHASVADYYSSFNENGLIFVPAEREGYDFYLSNVVEASYYEIACEAGGYIVYGDNVLLAATTDVSGELVLADDITGIWENAFTNCPLITHISFGSEFEYIGDYAFYGTSLEGEIAIPEKVWYIGIYAFYGCAGITDVNFGISLSKIGTSAFEGCTGLTKIVLNGTSLLIESSAFAWASGITDISWNPDATVQEIGSGAFSGTAIETIRIPGGVILGGNLFEYCNNLNTVYMDSENPPQLVLYYSSEIKIPFAFGFEDRENVRLVLEEDTNENLLKYVDAWKCEMMGYPYYMIDEMTDEEIAEGAKKVLALFGKENTDITSNNNGNDIVNKKQEAE